jgi:glycosidase
VLYYGTEIGLYQEKDKHDGGFGGDSEIRRDMVWNTAEWDNDLLAFFKESIALRHEYAVLRRGNWRQLVADVEKQVYGYALTNSAGDETAEIVVLFNLSDSSQEILVDGVEDVEMLLEVNGVVSAVVSEAGIQVVLPGLGGVMLGVD